MVGVGGYDYFLVVVVVRRVSLPDSFLAGVRLPVAIVICLFVVCSPRHFFPAKINLAKNRRARAVLADPFGSLLERN